MKRILDWKDEKVVNVFDEVTLWSAPFGRLMLENIPMKSQATVLDIGFGTGFPLIELAQRFGESSKIYGIDIWSGGIERAREKLKVFGIDHVQIFEVDAVQIDIEASVDLVTSNLGINNFEEKEAVYKEVNRVLKPGGALCITTNPVGTFDTLFKCFRVVMEEMDLKESLQELEKHIQHRGKEEEIVAGFMPYGFKCVKRKSGQTIMRFVDAEAIMNHALIRIGFRSAWEAMIPEEKRVLFFKKLIQSFEQVIQREGRFELEIPMLYLEFEKI